VTLIRRDGLVISPWRNGAGRTADIAAGPGWTVGFAFLDADAPFSDYSGHDRTITLVEGPGFTLTGPGREPLIVSVPATPAPFDGGWRVDCHIHGAPCVVLNAMTERAAWHHAVSVHRGAALPALAAGDVLVVLAGEVASGGEVARRHDALRIVGAATVHASADALVCRISIRPA
jgi:environmental stress-induced protein Ves